MTRTLISGAIVCGIAASVGAQGGTPGTPGTPGTAAGKPQTFKGLQMSVTSLDRAPSASLRDCPPGTNTVNAVTRPGEQFALVTVAFKAQPGFQTTPSLVMKRPSATDTAGKTYNTSVSFVDVGSVPEFSCVFPFRVPEGTKLKALQIETVSFDLSTLDSK
jgi:hypothetical protein